MAFFFQTWMNVQLQSPAKMVQRAKILEEDTPVHVREDSLAKTVIKVRKYTTPPLTTKKQHQLKIDIHKHKSWNLSAQHNLQNHRKALLSSLEWSHLMY